MALESGTYISDLNPSNPVSTDGLAQADDHLRLLKSTLQATLPGLTGAVTSTHTELNLLDGATVTTSELNVLDGATVTTAELNILDGVTSTAAELNLLDGATVTTAEINVLDGVTVTTAEINVLDGATVTTAELNTLDGITSTTSELNLLDGATVTTAELNVLDGITSTTGELNKLDGYTGNVSDLNLLSGLQAGGLSNTELSRVNGVTSSIQTQLDNKQNTVNGAASTVTSSDLTASRALISNSSGKVAVSAVTSTELGYLDGVTSSIQTQINTISSVPAGVIVMWSGANNAIPSGWAICNGANGTPDLRDRFVVGSGSTYATGATGGASTVTLTSSQMPAHNHSATSVSTVTDPGHTHDYKGQTGSSGSGVSSRDSVNTTLTTDSATTGITVSTSTSIGNTGGGQAHENKPPYYALAYIMKT